MDSLTQYYMALFILTQTPFDSCNFAALNLYTDLFTSYLELLGKRSAEVSAMSGRNWPSSLDLHLVLDSLGVDFNDLRAYNKSRKKLASLEKFISSSYPTSADLSQSTANPANTTSTTTAVANETSAMDTSADGEEQSLVTSVKVPDSKSPISPKSPQIQVTIPSQLPWLPPIPSPESIEERLQQLRNSSGNNDTQESGQKKMEIMQTNAREWTIKRPTNPYSFIEEANLDVFNEQDEGKLFKSLPQFLPSPISRQDHPGEQTISDNTANLPTDLLAHEVSTVLLEKEDLEQFRFSEMLAFKTNINYEENPHCIQFPTIKKRRFFLASRQLLESDDKKDAKSEPANPLMTMQDENGSKVIIVPVTPLESLSPQKEESSPSAPTVFISSDTDNNNNAKSTPLRQEAFNAALLKHGSDIFPSEQAKSDFVNTVDESDDVIDVSTVDDVQPPLPKQSELPNPILAVEPQESSKDIPAVAVAPVVPKPKLKIKFTLSSSSNLNLQPPSEDKK